MTFMKYWVTNFFDKIIVFHKYDVWIYEEYRQIKSSFQITIKALQFLRIYVHLYYYVVFRPYVFLLKKKTNYYVTTLQKILNNFFFQFKGKILNCFRQNWFKYYFNYLYDKKILWLFKYNAFTINKQCTKQL